MRLDDLPRLRPLRLNALRDHPSAFGADYQEEQTADLSRLIGTPPSVMLGGFVGEALVGSAGLQVSSGIKLRHKGLVFGFYVTAEQRRTGLARGLLDAVVAHARAEGLAMLTLSVTSGNDAARRLYVSAGFRTYGLEPAGLRIGQELLDVELLALRLD